MFYCDSFPKEILENLSQVIGNIYSFIFSVATFHTPSKFTDIDVSAK